MNLLKASLEWTDRLIIAPYGKASAEQERRVRLVTWLSLVIVAANLIRVLLFTPSLILYIETAASILGYVFSRLGYVRAAALLVVLALAAPVFINLIELSGFERDAIAGRAIWLALPLVLASIVLDWRGLLLYCLAVFGGLIGMTFFVDGMELSSIVGVLGWVGTLSLLLVLALRYRNAVERDRQAELISANAALRESEASLERRVQERTAELEIARSAAEQANQVKSQFLAAMSHELRTPLNAIINLSDFLGQGMFGDVNEEQVQTTDQVTSSARHLLALINDVLDISKIESGSLQLFIEDKVDLARELSTLHQTAQVLIEGKPVKVTLDIDPTLPAIRGDALRLRQVFMNLISNACKFTEQGEIYLGAKVQGSDVLVTVRDTGPGIRAEDQAQIFETFRQTEIGLRKGKGTGLGLAIARRLAEAHGGKLWVESREGAGATFTVQLPLRSELLVPAAI